MRRRTILGHIAGSSIVTVAGCLSSTEPTGENEDRGDDGLNRNGDSPPPLECEEHEEFERHAAGFEEDELKWEHSGTWELTINADTFRHGDTAQITLLNTSAEEQQTGNRYKYNIQVKTQAGWQDVRGWPDGRSLPYSDEGIIHEPEEGFEWTLPLTRDGLLNGHPHEDDLVVCPELPEGQYRFVYFSVSLPVAVGFTLTS